MAAQINTQYEKLDTGVKSILEGKDPNYGNKTIAIIESSDARSLDDIGKRCSYIKLSSPTIEGLGRLFSILNRGLNISQNIVLKIIPG